MKAPQEDNMGKFVLGNSSINDDICYTFYSVKFILTKLSENVWSTKFEDQMLC